LKNLRSVSEKEAKESAAQVISKQKFTRKKLNASIRA
jgi:hypothetical protein